MIKKTYTQKIDKPCLTIEYDESPTSPREDSNLGYFITVDRNYNSPDNHPDYMEIIKETGDIADNQANHMELIKKEIKRRLGDKILAIYPIVKLENGNVYYRLGTAHGFDYSNNGFYIVTDKTAKSIGVKKKDFEKIIKAELESYNNYVNGNIYMFTLCDENGDVVESCGGFENIDDIKDYLPEEYKNEDLSDYFKN